MQTTMNLLDRALKLKSPPEWARQLGLERTALHTARRREHLSPAVAGAIAEELGEDPREWVFVAAMESERDSACKERMLNRLKRAVRSYFNRITSVTSVGSSHKRTKDTEPLPRRRTRAPA